MVDDNTIYRILNKV